MFKEFKKLASDAQVIVLKGKALKNQVDSVTTESEKEILRNAKKLEMAGGMLDNAQREKLSTILNKLDHYTLTAAYTKNDNKVNEPPHLNEKYDTLEDYIKAMDASQNDDSVKVEIYALNSSSSEYLFKPVIVIECFGVTAIVYIDGKIKPGDAEQFIDVKTNTTISIEEIPD